MFFRRYRMNGFPRNNSNILWFHVLLRPALLSSRFFFDKILSIKFIVPYISSKEFLRYEFLIWAFKLFLHSGFLFILLGIVKLRCRPVYFLPYKKFFAPNPYLWGVLSGSATSVKGRLYFSSNFLCVSSHHIRANAGELQGLSFLSKSNYPTKLPGLQLKYAVGVSSLGIKIKEQTFPSKILVRDVLLNRLGLWI